MPSKIPISLYIVAIVALLLLAPYAGCHVITSKPDPGAYQDSQGIVGQDAPARTSDGVERLDELDELLR
jgi:hypothetical protein